MFPCIQGVQQTDNQAIRKNNPTSVGYIHMRLTSNVMAVCVCGTRYVLTLSQVFFLPSFCIDVRWWSNSAGSVLRRWSQANNCIETFSPQSGVEIVFLESVEIGNKAKLVEIKEVGFLLYRFTLWVLTIGWLVGWLDLAPLLSSFLSLSLIPPWWYDISPYLSVHSLTDYRVSIIRQNLENGMEERTMTLSTGGIRECWVPSFPFLLGKTCTYDAAWIGDLSRVRHFCLIFILISYFHLDALAQKNSTGNVTLWRIMALHTRTLWHAQARLFRPGGNCVFICGLLFSSFTNIIIR